MLSILVISLVGSGIGEGFAQIAARFLARSRNKKTVAITDHRLTTNTKEKRSVSLSTGAMVTNKRSLVKQKNMKKDDLFSLIFDLFCKLLLFSNLQLKIIAFIFRLVLQYELNFAIIKADSER